MTKASVSPAGDIPVGGGTYTVSLTGWGGYQVRAMSGSTVLTIKTDYTEVANYSATLQIPTNTEAAVRTVTFQYRFKGTWTPIETRTQRAQKPSLKLNYSDCTDHCSSRGGIPSLDQLHDLNWDGWAPDAYWSSTTWNGNHQRIYRWTEGYDGYESILSNKWECRCTQD